MAKDLMGPAAFGALNPATARPASAPSNSDGALDTWFKDCTSLTGRDGTAIVAGFMNFLLAQVRRAIRGMGIDESNLDDDMLLKAIQAASTGGAFPAHTHPQSQVINLVADLAGKVAKAGDTMTGWLTAPGLAAASYQPNIDLRDTSASNKIARLQTVAGSLFMHTDNVGDGAGLTQRIKVVAGSGDVIFTGPTPTLSLQRAAEGQSNALVGRRPDGRAIWMIEMGAWSNDAFVVSRYDSAGAWVGAPFSINQSEAWGIAGDYGAAGKLLSSQGSAARPRWADVGELLPILQYRWSVPANIIHGVFGGQAWMDYPLNTLIQNQIPGASASGGVISLPAGRYRCSFGGVTPNFWSPAYTGDGAGVQKVRLYNATTGAELANDHWMADFAEFTLAAAASVKLQYACPSTTYLNQTILGAERPIAYVNLTKVG